MIENEDSAMVKVYLTQNTVFQKYDPIEARLSSSSCYKFHNTNFAVDSVQDI